MKKTVSIFALIALCACSWAATWTIHGSKDNWLLFQVGHESDYPQSWEWAQWDFWNDQQYPEFADSGFFWSQRHEDQTVNYTNLLGWRESFTLEAQNPVVIGPVTFASGDYSGYVELNPELFSTPDEYWIDFAADGTVRISTIQPYDFGKWAWDGSVNPSWVEPLAKKGHGKGRK